MGPVPRDPGLRHSSPQGTKDVGGGGWGQQEAGVQLLSSHTAQDEALWATDTPTEGLLVGLAPVLLHYRTRPYSCISRGPAAAGGLSQHGADTPRMPPGPGCRNYLCLSPDLSHHHLLGAQGLGQPKKHWPLPFLNLRPRRSSSLCGSEDAPGPEVRAGLPPGARRGGTSTLVRGGPVSSTHRQRMAFWFLFH